MKRFDIEKGKLWAARSALQYLGKYASSSTNLHQVITRRAKRKFDDLETEQVTALADHAVNFCTDNGFLNDTSYAEMKASSGRRKGHSSRKIAATLSQKGVDREVISQTLSDTDDFEAAVRYASRKRMGPFRTRPKDEKTDRREAASFARQGYSSEISYRVLNLRREDAEEALAPSSDHSLP